MFVRPFFPNRNFSFLSWELFAVIIFYHCENMSFVVITSMVLWEFFFRCENIYAAVEIFLFAVRTCMVLWEFFFDCESCYGVVLIFQLLLWELLFWCENFSFVVKIYLLLKEILFCCENFSFAMISFYGAVRIFLLLWEIFFWRLFVCCESFSSPSKHF